jgi:hypothetical protein
MREAPEQELESAPGDRQAAAAQLAADDARALAEFGVDSLHG